MAELVTRKLRPGDIYTHAYSGLRDELDASGHVNPGMVEGRKRGVIFDVGHGGGSFAWRIAVPALKEGFIPDSISTDLHIGSMNSGMKDMLNVMDKFLAMGMSLDDVILRSTWNPAREVGHEDLGHLSVGAAADVTVIRLEKGTFGFVDMYGARMRRHAEADVRADASRRQSRVRPERDDAAGLDHAAAGLQTDRRRSLGRHHARAGQADRSKDAKLSTTVDTEDAEVQPILSHRILPRCPQCTLWWRFLSACEVMRIITLVICLALTAAPLRAQITNVAFEEIAHPKPGTWPTYDGNQSGNRFSPLDQINTGNVQHLAPKWMFTIAGAPRALQVTPIVVDGIMYVTSVNEVFALDARTGREIWHYQPATHAGSGRRSRPAGINRGVAVLGDRVFTVTDHAHLIALDRATGKLLWDVEMADFPAELRRDRCAARGQRPGDRRRLRRR